jgi:hypothetical protein
MLTNVTLNIAVPSPMCTIAFLEISLVVLLTTFPQARIYTSLSVKLLPWNGAQGLHVRISDILDTIRFITFK